MAKRSTTNPAESGEAPTQRGSTKQTPLADELSTSGQFNEDQLESDSSAKGKHDIETGSTTLCLEDRLAPHLDAVDSQVTSPPETRPRHRSARFLAALAFGVGILVGVTTFLVNRVAIGSSQAQASVILDERQVHWPFYGAAYEQAEAIISEDTTFEAARSSLTQPSLALSISLEPSSDQSIIIVNATADSDRSALELAEAAATQLVDRSHKERRTIQADVVDRLAQDVTVLLLAQEVAKQSLAAAENQVDQIIAEKNLEHAADRLNLKRTSLQIAAEVLDDSGPMFISTGRAELQGRVTQSLLASVSAGAGSMVLVLLAFSLLANATDDD